MATFKTLSDDSWLVINDENDIGVLNQTQDNYVFIGDNIKISFKSKNEVKEHFGKMPKSNNDIDNVEHDKHVFVQGYPINYTNPVMITKDELDTNIPIFAKTMKKDVIYCAGYFAVYFEKGWAKTFCPKLITVEKYKTLGPYKTQEELNTNLKNYK